MWNETGKVGARYDHGVAVVSGGVLVAGGKSVTGSAAKGDQRQVVLKTAELFNGTTSTQAGTLAVERSAFALVTMPGGKVVAVGGNTSDKRSEVYDPATKAWTVGGSFPVAIYGHAGAESDDGALIFGGFSYAVPGASPATAQKAIYKYSEASNSVSKIGDMKVARAYPVVTKLQDGRYLVSGGTSAGGSGMNAAAIDSCEIFDPATSTSKLLPQKMQHARTGHGAAEMDDGDVLVWGGYNGSTYHKSADVIDPDAESITPAAALPAGVALMSAGNVSGVGVLSVGGVSGSNKPTAASHVFKAGVWSDAGALKTARYGTRLAVVGGKPTVTGGRGGSVLTGLPTAVETYSA